MGVGARRGGRARRAHHRRQHRHHQRRRRQQRHHHHGRTGHHGTRARTFGLLFASHPRRTGAGVHGTQATTVPNSTRTSESNGRTGCRTPNWLVSCLVAVLLLTGTVVPFAIQAVPFPIGITCAVLFIFIILVPLVTNISQRYKARRGADAEAPQLAEEVPTVASTIFHGHTSINMDGLNMSNTGGTNGVQPNTGYAYDPPPSFTEATAPSSHQTATATPEPDGVMDGTSQQLPHEPLGYPATEPYFAAAGEAQPDATDLPPPPSYEEAVGGGTT